MRKKKWQKILIWTFSVIVVLVIGGLFAANYAIDKVISTIAADLESNQVTDDILNSNLNEDKTIVTDNASENIKQQDVIDTKDEQELREPGKDENKPLIGEITKPEKDGNSDEEYSAEITLDKAKDVQEKITISEKAQLSSVLLEKLSISDIKQLQALVNGGLNLEEKKKARSIILEKLSAEQYDELIQVAKKYGMSQGKSYDQVIQDK